LGPRRIREDTMAKRNTTRRKARMAVLEKKPIPGRIGKRPVKLARTDRKQRVRDAGPRHGGR